MFELESDEFECFEKRILITSWIFPFLFRHPNAIDCLVFHVLLALVMEFDPISMNIFDEASEFFSIIRSTQVVEE